MEDELTYEADAYVLHDLQANALGSIEGIGRAAMSNETGEEAAANSANRASAASTRSSTVPPSSRKIWIDCSAASLDQRPFDILCGHDARDATTHPERLRRQTSHGIRLPKAVITRQL